MADERKLLVVDDEEVVCQACRRIFSRQGFQVETNTDAEAGPRQGHGKRLRDHPPGHQDAQYGWNPVPRAAPREEARRSGADHHRLSQHPQRGRGHASRRLRLRDQTVHLRGGHVGHATRAEHAARAQRRGRNRAPRKEKRSLPRWPNIETLFWDESWVQLAVDGSALVGAVLPGLRGASITGIRTAEDRRSRLPGPAAGRGQRLRQTDAGHPLANLRRRGGSQLAGGPSSSIVGKRSLRGRLDRRRLRHAARGNGKLQAAPPGPGQCRSLLGRRASRGSSPTWAASRKGRRTPTSCSPPWRKSGERVVFLDAASLGEEGPGLVERVNRQAPHARIVVLATRAPACRRRREAAYRKHKIFYYAVEPFADNEIADILMGVFHAPRRIVDKAQPAKTEHPKGPSEPISSISITNRNLHKVQLLAAPGLLWGNEGLGLQIGQKLLAQMFPVVVTPGETQLTPANILKAGEACDRVMVLLARDSGLLPGGLARDTKPDFDVEPGDPPCKRRHSGHSRPVQDRRRARWRCSRCSRTNWGASPASTPGPSPPWPTISFGTWRRIRT